MIICKSSNFNTRHNQFTLNTTHAHSHANALRGTTFSRKHTRPNTQVRCLVFTSSVDTPRWRFASTVAKRSNGSDSGDKEKVKKEQAGGVDTITGSSNNSESREVVVDIGEREVKCEVEVVSWRERRVKAELCVNADIRSVWNALTDYERLADFIPNLVSRCNHPDSSPGEFWWFMLTGTIPCPHAGRIWLEQRGLQRALYWHIEARVVLDLQEISKSADERELHFSMVDGDFKKFEGKWSLKSGKRSSTTLLYEVNVIPRFNFPAIFLERIIRSDLPVNLQALAFRAEQNFEGTQKLKMAVNSVSQNLDGALLNDKKTSPREFNEAMATSSAGELSSSPTEPNSKWGVFGKVCRLDRPCVVDEVHLRRLDGLLENGGVHRCVVASITVKAPVREVWKVLTAYESLPEIVPNLAISKILSRENNRVRILQEGCKGLLYMMLHARVVLDLCEYLEKEICFEQVEGDFDSFQGKWIFEQLGNHHTLLKYSVESKMHKDCFLSEAIMEEVIYEDLPSNLCAIRDYIENSDVGDAEESDDNRYFSEQSASSGSDETAPSSSVSLDSSDFCSENSFRQRPRVPGLQRDLEVLKVELQAFISEHGQEGFMPMRKQLRLHGRVDIEKAIAHMGGFRRIASLMNLSLAYKHRKPKGYWDNLENLEEEIQRFQRSWGMDPTYMPSRKSFERAGRYDIARALEKWGGLHEVSRLLSLKVRHPNRQAGLSREKKKENVIENAVESEDKSLSKEYVSQDTQKWLSQLKHLDINWVE